MGSPPMIPPSQNYRSNVRVALLTRQSQPPPPAVARWLAPCRSGPDRLKARIESINSIAAVWLQFKVDRREAVGVHSRIKLCWVFFLGGWGWVPPVVALMQHRRARRAENAGSERSGSEHRLPLEVEHLSH